MIASEYPTWYFSGPRDWKEACYRNPVNLRYKRGDILYSPMVNEIIEIVDVPEGQGRYLILDGHVVFDMIPKTITHAGYRKIGRM